MSWLLKSIAVEVKITAERGLQSHSSRLASLFLYDIDENSETLLGETTDRSFLSGTSFLGTQDKLMVRSRPKIAVLLDAVNLKVSLSSEIFFSIHVNSDADCNFYFCL